VIKKGIIIIGAGKVGAKLAVALFHEGYNISAVINKPYNLALKLGSEVNAGTVSENLDDIPAINKIVFVCVEDSKIRYIAEYLAQLKNIKKSDFIVHTSGVLTVEALKPLKNKGCQVGGFHPMQTFPDISYSSRGFRNIYIGLEGDEKVVTLLRSIAQSLGCKTVHLKSQNKVPYHLGGVFASNFFVCLLYMIKNFYEKAGISEKDSLELLEPIILQTLSNVKKKGIIDSLSGPLTRGDATSIDKHLNYIEKNFPEFKFIYLRFSEVALQIVKEKGAIDVHKIRKLEKLLDKKKNA